MPIEEARVIGGIGRGARSVIRVGNGADGGEIQGGTGLLGLGGLGGLSNDVFCLFLDEAGPFVF